jgi:hypothetical protein
MISNRLASSALRPIGICCVLAMLSACEPSMDEVITKHRPATEAVFSKLEALDTPAQNAPPLSEDRVTIDSERVVLEGEDSNALFILAYDLQAPESASDEQIGARRAGTVKACGELLRGEFHGAPAGATHFLTECGRAKYVFALRTTTEILPLLIDEETFQSGLYEGDVLLYRLADGALLGGFRVSAANSAEVSSKTDLVISRLEEDLNSHLLADIDAKLREQVPGVIP